MGPRIRCLSSFFTLALAVGLAGCAPKSRATVPAAAGPADSIEYLRSDLERIFSDPIFANAQWGAEVVSLDRGDVLFEHNATRLYMPASNNKIVTAAAALVRLGADYRFETRVATNGEVVDGILTGDLIVTGSGDPSAAARFHGDDPFAVFKEWAGKLKEKGIRAIAGSIVGDGSRFPPPALGSGWEWDDLPYGYAAPVTALQFNENLLTVAVTPGAKEGLAADVRISPLPGYLAVDASITTVAKGVEGRIAIRRGEQNESIVLRGTIAEGSEADRSAIAAQLPNRYYAAALRQALQDAGIDVSQASVRSSEERDFVAPPSAQLLWIHTSPPLAEIVKPLMKVSQNLYAETLARALGLALRGEGTFRAGQSVVEETLEGMAVPRGGYAYVDGSGLSRSNLVTADMLIRILRHMYRHKSFPQFCDALPVAGVDGSIRGRMKGTRAEDNVRGKTGSIRYVRSLSGYVKTAEGEMLAFSMIANNFLASSRTAEYVQDSALERIAAFRRR